MQQRVAIAAVACSSCSSSESCGSARWQHAPSQIIYCLSVSVHIRSFMHRVPSECLSNIMPVSECPCWLELSNCATLRYDVRCRAALSCVGKQIRNAPLQLWTLQGVTWLQYTSYLTIQYDNASYLVDWESDLKAFLHAILCQIRRTKELWAF